MHRTYKNINMFINSSVKINLFNVVFMYQRSIQREQYFTTKSLRLVPL